MDAAIETHVWTPVRTEMDVAAIAAGARQVRVLSPTPEKLRRVVEAAQGIPAGSGIATLQLEGCKDLSTKDIAVLARLPELKHLVLINTGELDGEALLDFKSFEGLRSLKIMLYDSRRIPNASEMRAALRPIDLTLSLPVSRHSPLRLHLTLAALPVALLLYFVLVPLGKEAGRHLGWLEDPRAESGCDVSSLEEAEDVPAYAVFVEVWSHSNVDESMEIVAKLPKLKRLRLQAYQGYTDRALKAIGGMRTLERLEISADWGTDSAKKSSFTAEGYKYLANLTGLKVLLCHGRGSVTNAAFRALEGHRNLEIIMLSNCRRITDAAFESIGTCGNLRVLSISSCGDFSERGLKALAPLGKLEVLHLGDGATDGGLKAIERMEHLRILIIRDWGNRSIDGEAVIHAGLSPAELAAADRSSIFPGVLRVDKAPLSDAALTSLSKLRALELLKILSYRRVSEAAKGITDQAWKTFELARPDVALGFDNFPPAIVREYELRYNIDLFRLYM